MRCLLPYLNYRYTSNQILKMIFEDRYFHGEHMTDDEIEVQRGTLQGASLSPLLFNIALRRVFRVLEQRDDNGCFVYEDCFATMFADDVLLQGDPSTVFNALEALVEPLSRRSGHQIRQSVTSLYRCAGRMRSGSCDVQVLLARGFGSRLAPRIGQQRRHPPLAGFEQRSGAGAFWTLFRWNPSRHG